MPVEMQRNERKKSMKLLQLVKCPPAQHHLPEFDDVLHEDLGVSNSAGAFHAASCG
jgi:hypothetical protein